MTKPTNSPDQLVGLGPRPRCCTQFLSFLSLTVGQSGHVCSLYHPPMTGDPTI